ncbi:MAG: hypothetical protein K2V38_25720, partial [Gemmataceae bacterium]|nr:hypothetical protein [Gemmataceae bacterium]
LLKARADAPGEANAPLKAITCEVAREIGPAAAPLAPCLARWAEGDETGLAAETALQAIGGAAASYFLPPPLDSDALGVSGASEWPHTNRSFLSVREPGFQLRQRELRVPDPINYATRHAYDATGRLLSTTDALGRVTAYTYDATGKLTSEIDAGSHATTYQYPSDDLLLSRTAALCDATAYTYDAAGQLVAESIGEFLTSAKALAALIGGGELPRVARAFSVAVRAEANKPVAEEGGNGIKLLMIDQLDRGDMAENREDRVRHAAEEIQAVVADLPADERQEAETHALVTGVPEALPYPEQVKAFTQITHTMRVKMARQLEPRFQEHLRNDAPKLPAFEAGRETEQQAEFANQKAAFADQKTDELFRLGLGIRWQDRPEVCYLSSASTDKTPLGAYRIIPCGHRAWVKDIAGWAPSQVGWVRKTTSTSASFVHLVDAAALGERNSLSPNMARRV